MKTWKKGFIGLLVIFVIAFATCKDDDGNGKDGSNGVYAGTWIGEYNNFIIVSDLTFETHTKDNTNTPMQKGIIAINDNVVTLTFTHTWASESSTWNAYPNGDYVCSGTVDGYNSGSTMIIKDGSTYKSFIKQ